MITEKFIRLPQVMERTTRSKPAIYVDIKKGLFPAPVKIGLRAVAWRESDVVNWMSERIATRAAL